MTLQAQQLKAPNNPIKIELDRSREPRASKKIRVAQFGLGMIGIEALRLAATKPWIDVVAGIDINPEMNGVALSELTGVDAHEKVEVYSSFQEMADATQADVILHTAGSKVGQTFDQIEPMIRSGVSIVSTCEELLYPQLREPQRSVEFDALCKRFGAGVVGTGVNPGFVMDVLPVCLTGVSRSVKSIYVEREVNASTRRMQLQKKVGSGMKPDDFRALFAAGKAGHAGFRESAALICHSLGWKVEQIVETCEPMIADHDIRTEFFSVATGLTCGLHQVVTVRVEGMGTPLIMDLKMYLDAPNPHDSVKVVGEPSLNMTLNGGVAGDHATVAALVNAIPRVLKAGGGLHLMTDLAVPSWV